MRKARINFREKIMIDIQKVQCFANDLKKEKSTTEKNYQKMGQYLLKDEVGLLSTMIKGRISIDNAHTIWFAMSALALDDMQRFAEAVNMLINDPKALQVESEGLNAHQFAAHNLLHLKKFSARDRFESGSTFNPAYTQCEGRIKSASNKHKLKIDHTKKPNAVDTQKMLSGMQKNLMLKKPILLCLLKS